MRTGDIVTLVSPQGEITPFGARPAQFRFRVTGIFESGFFDLDNEFGFTSLENAQRVFLTGDVVNSLELRIRDLDRAPEIARRAEALAGRIWARRTGWNRTGRSWVRSAWRGRCR